ncbi:MAG: TIGR03435 family protein [Acidobacteriaceae bacterium]
MIPTLPHRRPHANRLPFAVILIAITLSVLHATAHQLAPTPSPHFEVASLRPISPNVISDPPSDLDLDASDESRYTGGLISANGYLINFIIFAYKIADTTQYPLTDAQLPPWAHTQRFHLEARPIGTPTKDQIRLMVQLLLKDRFHLSVHNETRQLPVYALVLDKPNKPGPQLKPSPSDSPCTPHAPSSDSSASQPPTYCAPFFTHDADGLWHMKILDWTMQQIAGDIATIAANMGALDPRPVLDQTGLNGRFDLTLDFVRESRIPQPNDASAPQVSGLTFSGALKKQAGLLLIKQTGPVNAIIIDHVDQPSEN